MEPLSTAAPIGRQVGADRVLTALKRLAEFPQGATLDELARALAAPKSSVHRDLARLKRAGFAEQRGDGRYVLGLELVRIAFAFHDNQDMPKAATPALEELARRFGETAHYAELRGADVVYLAKERPSQGAVQMTSLVGGRNPAYCTGVGKAMLAYELPTRRAVSDFVHAHGPLVRRTRNTLTSASALAEALAEVRRRGFAVDEQESEDGINCIAVPLFLGRPARPSGAVSVAALAHRMPLAALLERVDEMRAALRRHLGAHAVP
jgi:IclR family transcriptional regulator, acetate operon repressor